MSSAAFLLKSPLQEAQSVPMYLKGLILGRTFPKFSHRCEKIKSNYRNIYMSKTVTNNQISVIYVGTENKEKFI